MGILPIYDQYKTISILLYHLANLWLILLFLGQVSQSVLFEVLDKELEIVVTIVAFKRSALEVGDAWIRCFFCFVDICHYHFAFGLLLDGIDLSIQNAIEAIATCLRSEEQYCVNVPEAMPSMKSLGF